MVPDDIRGWYEAKGGERVREPGLLETFNLSAEDAEALIMRARVAAGWIEPEILSEDVAEEGDAVEQAPLDEASVVFGGRPG